jgi:hypothetical protein
LYRQTTTTNKIVSFIRLACLLEIVAGYERPFPRLRSLLCLAQRGFPLLSGVVLSTLLSKDGIGNLEGAMRRAMIADGIAGAIKLLHYWGFADRAKEGPGQRSIPRALCWSLAHRIGPAHPDTFANMRLSATVRALCFPSRTGPSLRRVERKGGEGEVCRRIRPFRHPTTAVQENGTYGGQGEAVRRGGAPTALLFVALGQRPAVS